MMRKVGIARVALALITISAVVHEAVGLPHSGTAGKDELQARIDAMEPWEREEFLCDVAESGATETVRRLLAARANANATCRSPNGTEGTALMFAAGEGHTDVVQVLLAAGASVGLMSKGGDTALVRAATGGSLDTVKVLLAAGADVHAGSDAALIGAAARGSTATVEALLAAGASVDATDQNGNTALSRAARAGRTETVRTLIAAGADVNVNAGSRWRDTPLILAARAGHTDSVKALLAAGADVHARSDDALGNAAFGGHSETVKVLLAAGANVDAAGEDGTTALSSAAARGRAETVELLLAAGARVDMQNKRGETALIRAEANHHPEVIALLKKAGAKAAPAAMALGAHEEEKPRAGSLEGTVEWRLSGQPLKAASVILGAYGVNGKARLDPNLFAHSDEEGNFSISDIPPGTYAVLYTAWTGIRPIKQEVTVDIGLLLQQDFSITSGAFTVHTDWPIRERIQTPLTGSRRSELFKEFGIGSIPAGSRFVIGGATGALTGGDGAIITTGWNHLIVNGRPLMVNIESGQVSKLTIKAWGK